MALTFEHLWFLHCILVMNITPTQKKSHSPPSCPCTCTCFSTSTSIGLFCAASCSQLNASKSQAFLVQSQPLASATVSALQGISFSTGQQTVKRFFVLVGYRIVAHSFQAKEPSKNPGEVLLPQPRQPLSGSRAFQHLAPSSFRTPKPVRITHSHPIVSYSSPPRLPQLLALCVSFLGTLPDPGGVQHGNQLSQLLRFTHKGSCGAPTTCHWGCGAGDSSLPTS